MKIKGKIKIIKNYKDYYKIVGDVIIVANKTSPDITVVINRVKAIITEIDNKLCHAAIIAREYNKPLIMGIDKATKRFRDGQVIVIDTITKKII